MCLESIVKQDLWMSKDNGTKAYAMMRRSVEIVRTLCYATRASCCAITVPKETTMSDTTNPLDAEHFDGALKGIARWLIRRLPHVALRGYQWRVVIEGEGIQVTRKSIEEISIGSD